MNGSEYGCDRCGVTVPDGSGLYPADGSGDRVCHGCAVLCACCGGPCDAIDAVATDAGLAFCGSFRGRGCADAGCDRAETCQAVTA